MKKEEMNSGNAPGKLIGFGGELLILPPNSLKSWTLTFSPSETIMSVPSST